MYLVLWLEHVDRWSNQPRVSPVRLTIEREARPLTRLAHGCELVAQVVAAIDGPDDVAEHAIRFLLLPAMTRALLEPWPELPVDGAAAVDELVRRVGARPNGCHDEVASDDGTPLPSEAVEILGAFNSIVKDNCDVLAERAANVRLIRAAAEALPAHRAPMLALANVVAVGSHQKDGRVAK